MRTIQGTGTQSAERLLDLLAAFSSETVELTGQQLIARAGLTRSTGYRLLALLVERGFLCYDSTTRMYRPGGELARVGAIAQANTNVRHVALPIMRDLRDETGETVYLSILQDGHRVCVEQVESRHFLRHVMTVGRRRPLHSGATSKCLLAFLPGTQPEEWIRAADATGSLPVPAEGLLAVVREARRRGYTTSEGDVIGGVASVSVPVFNHAGACVAALTVSGPDTRVRERWDELIEKAVAAAREVSRAMGYSADGLPALYPVEG